MTKVMIQQVGNRMSDIVKCRQKTETEISSVTSPRVYIQHTMIEVENEIE